MFDCVIDCVLVCDYHGRLSLLIMHWFHKFLAHILRTGPVPRHLAIIMDGNRRYASKHSLSSSDGHTAGYHKLLQILEWCRELDIKIVTVYAFSIDNFKRSEAEVSYLMSLFKEKFTALMQQKSLIQRHGICVRIIGNLLLLPDDVRQCAEEIVEWSRHNKDLYLNICMAYTTQQEVTDAATNIALQLQQQHHQHHHHNNTTNHIHNVSNPLSPSTSSSLLSSLSSSMYLTPAMFMSSLYTGSLPVSSPCLLLRTSGEYRLSDFLLYQCRSSSLSFLSVYWPELTFKHFFTIIMNYQREQQQIYHIQQHIKDKQQQREDQRLIWINMIIPIHQEQHHMADIDINNIADTTDTNIASNHVLSAG